jgi:hypothetical protein
VRDRRGHGPFEAIGLLRQSEGKPQTQRKAHDCAQRIGNPFASDIGRTSVNGLI